MLVGVGTRHPHPEGKLALPFAAQFAEVEVDTRTGEVRVLRFLAAQDSGRVMNRLTFDNQVFGGITMGIGFALTEERVLDRADRQDGQRQLARLQDADGARRARRQPSALPIDPHDTECNTAGAKGLGEPAHDPGGAGDRQRHLRRHRRADARRAGQPGARCSPRSPAPTRKERG